MYRTAKTLIIALLTLFSLTAFAFAGEEERTALPMPLPDSALGNTEGIAASTAHGAPVWSVSKTGLNVYITDIPIWYTPPVGPKVEIQLSYNSLAPTVANAPFGNKWMLNFGSYLKEGADNNVRVFMPDGGKDIYELDGGIYKKPIGVFNTLTKVVGSPATFNLSFLDGTVYTYTVPGIGGLTDYYLSEIKDVYNNTLTITYTADASDKLTAMTITPSVDPIKQTVLQYDANGHIQTMTEPFGRTASFGYTNDMLTSITDMGGYATSFSYNGNSHITSIQNLKGTWAFKTEPDDNALTTAEYPPPDATMGYNYRVTITNPPADANTPATKEEYYYNATRGSSWYVSPNDYVTYVDVNTNNLTQATKTKYFIDRSSPKARLKKVLFPEGGYIKYTDVDPLTSKHTKETDYHDDEGGQPVTHTTQYTYNENGLVTSIIPPIGKATYIDYYSNDIDIHYIRREDMTPKIELAYNAAHDITSFQDQVNLPTTFEYETDGQLKKIIQPLGLTTEFVYDPTTRYLTDIKKGGSVISSFTYDTMGRVWTQTGPTGIQTTYEYNNLDKMTKVTFPDTKYIQINRSTLHPHLINSIIDRSGLTTQYFYDALNQLTEVKGPIEGSANTYIYDYQYDKNGNLWKIIDMTKSPAAETVFEYNKDDLITKKTYADGKFVTYTYDKQGLPKTFKNARLTIKTYTFDANHNLTNITYNDNPATPAVTFVYDDYNRMTSRTDGTGQTLFTYLANDRLESVDGPLAGDKLTYHYNALGNLIDITPEQGQAVTYLYDYDTGFDDIDLGRLKRITAGSNTFTYDYAGVSPLIMKLTRPNGSFTDYVYDDPLKRLTAIVNNRKYGEPPVTELINSFAYTFDKDLIKTETVTNGTIIDNFLEKTTAYVPNAVNQLVSTTTAPNPAKVYDYDNDGNMTTGNTPADIALTMTYDAENRMKTAQYDDGISHLLQYSYAGNSLLSEVIKDGSTTKYRRYRNVTAATTSRGNTSGD